MSYCTLQQARRQLETSQTADNRKLADLLLVATQAIDDESGYMFEERYETHAYSGDLPLSNPTLYLDDWPLVSIDSFLNGDGTTIAGANFTLLPVGRYPKKEVRLTLGNYFVPPVWPFPVDAGYAVDALQITGRWSWNRQGPNAWLRANNGTTDLTVSGAHSASVTTLTLNAQALTAFEIGSVLKVVIASGAIEYLYVTGPLAASTDTSDVVSFATTTPTVIRGWNGSTALALAGGEAIYVYQVERTIQLACAEVVAAMYKSRDNAMGSAFNPGGFGTITIADMPDKVLAKLHYPYRSYVRGKPEGGG